MGRLIHTYLSKAIALIFPEKCIGCKKEGIFLCSECREATRKENAEKVSVLYADKIFSWGIYDNEVLRKALRRFKYHGNKSLAEIFSNMLWKIMNSSKYNLNDAVIFPVPASKIRKRQRGYNQAEILAQKLAEKISLPYFSDILIKIKNTPSQTSLPKKERLMNVKGSFGINNPEFIKNKKIILVDDILTTGATISECSKILKNAGAKEVIAFVVAI